MSDSKMIISLGNPLNPSTYHVASIVCVFIYINDYKVNTEIPLLNYFLKTKTSLRYLYAIYFFDRKVNSNYFIFKDKFTSLKAIK